jgi:hypothetical protein
VGAATHRSHLNTSTTEFLQELLDYTCEHLTAGTLDEDDTRRAKKFAANLTAGIDRIRADRGEHGPWQWAPELAALHPPRSRTLIAKHLAAIARHRADTLRSQHKRTPADLELWNLLIEAGVRRTPPPRD